MLLGVFGSVEVPYGSRTPQTMVWINEAPRFVHADTSTDTVEQTFYCENGGISSDSKPLRAEAGREGFEPPTV